MNPYRRFLVVANAVSAAIVLTLVSLVSGALFETYKAAGFQSELAPFVAASGALAVTIVVWLALTDAVLPFFFRYTSIRRVVLGKHYMEGTWIQAEKHDGAPRMAVIEIQPAGTKFRFSGYAVDENLEVQSNVVMEFSKFDWPFMTYKYRNTLADTAEAGREGVGEIHFEANRNAPTSYNGFVQTVNGLGRVKIEGVRLMKNREIRNLRSLEYRADIIDKYWGLFFERGNRKARMLSKTSAGFSTNNTAETYASRQPSAAPVSPASPRKEARVEPRVEPRAQQKATTANFEADRRVNEPVPEEFGPVVPRRRMSDWAKSEEVMEYADLDDLLEDPVETPLEILGRGPSPAAMEMSSKAILKK